MAFFFLLFHIFFLSLFYDFCVLPDFLDVEPKVQKYGEGSLIVRRFFKLGLGSRKRPCAYNFLGT